MNTADQITCKLSEAISGMDVWKPIRFSAVSTPIFATNTHVSTFNVCKCLTSCFERKCLHSFALLRPQELSNSYVEKIVLSIFSVKKSAFFREVCQLLYLVSYKLYQIIILIIGIPQKSPQAKIFRKLMLPIPKLVKISKQVAIIWDLANNIPRNFRNSL